ncbi:MAG: hypothetical protein IJD85_08745 [Oscillospiraceae bacterium]|nr:hypothetical protein [Oscillospiraceae bacterium]
MSDTNSDYREAKRRKRKARTIRNITVFAVLMLILVGLFVIKFTRGESEPESGASITETIEQ